MPFSRLLDTFLTLLNHTAVSAFLPISNMRLLLDKYLLLNEFPNESDT